MIASGLAGSLLISGEIGGAGTPAVEAGSNCAAVNAWPWWRKPSRPGDEPVMLVHGFADTYYTPWWWILKSRLKGKGYSSGEIHSVNLGRIPGITVLSPKRYAEKLAGEVAKVHRATGKKVDIIAHSMGGLEDNVYYRKGETRAQQRSVRRAYRQVGRRAGTGGGDSRPSKADTAYRPRGLI